MNLYLQARLAELQLSVLQQSADASAPEEPKSAENVVAPVAGQRDDDAHAL